MRIFCRTNLNTGAAIESLKQNQPIGILSKKSLPTFSHCTKFVELTATHSARTFASHLQNFAAVGRHFAVFDNSSPSPKGDCG
jgi:hypothetical protein